MCISRTGNKCRSPGPARLPGCDGGTDGPTWSHRGPWDRWLCDPRVVRTVHLENTRFSVILAILWGAFKAGFKSLGWGFSS